MHKTIGCYHVRKTVRIARKQLQTEYKKICRRGVEQPCDEWLADNYYLLRKTADHALDALKKNETLPKEGEMPRIWFFVSDMMQGDSLPDFDAALQQMPGLNTKEFEVLEVMCKCVCVDQCVQAYQKREEEKLSRIIQVLRKLPEIDFEELCEKYCSTSRILAQDPSGIYAQMSLQTRAMYRSVCYEISKKQNSCEDEVARQALSAAQEAKTQEEQHIGEWLWKSSGRFKPSRQKGYMLWVLRLLLPAIACVMLALILQSWIVVLLYFPLFQMFRAVLDWSFSRFLSVPELPRMDETTDVVQNIPTAAVISCMVFSPQDCEKMQEHLHHMALCNPDRNLSFCVLADFGEHEQPKASTDEVNVAAMRRMIQRLNRQTKDRFVLLVRERSWIQTQHAYGGWERKRGAIMQLVDLIQTDKNAFLYTEGNLDALKQLKYLILLDSDTKMLLHSARRLIATAAHPLNRPVVDMQKKSVVRGYGILSPRIESDIVSAGKTFFSRLISGSGGFSSYDGSCVDLNQALFGETVFCGKGIVDVAAMHSCLHDAFAQETVLSHDILEGGYLRCGFCSDVRMTDHCPQTFASWLKRLHRWIRGDSQNTLWLFERVPSSQGKIKNPFFAPTKLFLIDNLLRAASQAMPWILLIAAVLFPQYAVWLTISALLSNSAAYWFSALECFFRGGILRLTRRYYSQVMPDALEMLARGVFFSLQTFELSKTVLHGLFCGWFRVFFSRRNLLEWTTASQSDSQTQGGLMSVLRQRKVSFLCGILLSVLFGGLIRLCGMILIAAPLIESGIKTVILHQRPFCSERDKQQLIAFCADQWRFYQEFCGLKDHGLPPDNYQEAPVKRIAHRTSPTNIGFYLLSLVAVFKFGFIDEEEFFSRIELALNSVRKLEKYHGNLLNWYDTKTLQSLNPRYCSTVDSGNFVGCLIAVSEALKTWHCSRAEVLSKIADELIAQTDLSVLYHSKRKLFHIGFDLQTRKLSDSYYDLMMSEARLTSYISVAAGQVPLQHWSQLGRMIVQEGAYTGSVSWSGTAFEYFMPHVLLPVLTDTAFYETMAFCVYCQKREAKRRQLPFGVSESGYFAFDRELNYQYKAHGIERLALKKERRKEYVVSPYSSFLMLEIAPRSVMQNLRRLRKEFSCYGDYGFYEAIDFTKERTGAVPQQIRSYMAHHVGMSLCAACNYLENGYLRNLFMSGTMSRGFELMDEKIPSGAQVFRDQYESNEIKKMPRLYRKEESDSKPNILFPRAFLYSNGNLSAILTDTGLSRFRWNQLDLLRWERDYLNVPKGLFAAVCCPNGETLSLQAAPTLRSTNQCSSKFSAGSADFFAENHFCSAGMRVVLHPSKPILQIVIRLSCKQLQKAVMDTVIYFEPLLGHLEAFEAHKMYSMLFVQANQINEQDFSFERRNKKGETSAAMVVRVLSGHLKSFEFSRECVLDQGYPSEFWRNVASFSSKGNGLPDACGAFCFSHEFEHDNKQEIRLAIGIEDTVQHAVQMLNQNLKVCEPNTSAARMPYLSSSLEGQITERVLPPFFGVSKRSSEQLSALRQTDDIEEKLWSLGISGNKITIMYRYQKKEDALLLRACVHVFQRFCFLQLPFDLVVLYQGGDGYHDDLLHQISQIIQEEGAREYVQSGGIYLINKDSISPEVFRAVLAFCDVVLCRESFSQKQPLHEFQRRLINQTNPVELHHDPNGLLVNFGEFSSLGDFTVTANHALPWTHLLANESFGCMLSDQTLGYTWAMNSRENRLTPWVNDTRSDNMGERLLLRYKGELYDLIHGSVCTFGKNYARYCSQIASMYIQVNVTIFQLCKQISVEIKSDRPQEIALCYLTIPVMGVNTSASRFLTAIWDQKLIISNGWNRTFSGEIHISSTGKNQSCCCDLISVLSGRWEHHSLLPAKFPCAAVITAERIEAHQAKAVSFQLEWVPSQEHMVLHQKAISANEFELHSCHPTLDVLFNDWLPRQVKICRLYARTAFYQSSGAYGFRDQLQDVCALLYLEQNLTREHILRCCKRQFEEGDVLHWWHEYPNRISGVRTRCSDDLLWLCYAVSEYLRFTGDEAFLSEMAPFLTAPLLEADEMEKYLQTVQQTEKQFSIYEHCVRAADHVKCGEHGLPLIGTCDWNDGFSELGVQGKGESVWLAMFCVEIFERMAELSQMMHQAEKAEQYLKQADILRKNIMEHTWDSDRFLRAFDDEGTPLGGRGCDECEIDSLTQSFAVFTQCGDESMRELALDSAVKYLVDHENRLIRLFTPPIVHRKAGYIAAYPPGIRENGGQYTHAAVWLTAALLVAGRLEQGFECLMMLNPAQKYRDRQVAERYLGEPYSMPADIYTNSSCVGRVGWTQYTGAAGWYYQTILRVLLGIQIQGDSLTIKPHLPSEFGQAEVSVTIEAKTFKIFFKPKSDSQHPGIYLTGEKRESISLKEDQGEILVIF